MSDYLALKPRSRVPHPGPVPNDFECLRKTELHKLSLEKALLGKPRRTSERYSVTHIDVGF